MNNPKQKTCTVCGASISVTASICKYCLKPQKTWKNRVITVATTLGAAALAASFILHTISILPNARKVVFWREHLALIAFKMERYAPQNKILVASNNGDGPLLVSHVVIEGFSTTKNSSHFKHSFRVGKVVDPRNFLNYIKGKKQENHWKGLYVHNVNDAEWESIRSLASDKNDSRYRTEYFSANDLRYIQIREKYKSKKRVLRTYQAKGKVYYYSAKENAQKFIIFDVVACILKLNEPYYRSAPESMIELNNDKYLDLS
jgi:hypothetical protein